MIKMSRKAKKAMAVALTAGMLASTAATPVMAATEGWKKNSTGWWYQNADGSWPASKWEKINGSWYYFDANGYMKANSWAQDASGKWYYLGVNGAMKVNSWAQDASGKWYFVGADGAMKANSWAQDASGKWYFLGADGAMVTNTWAKDKNALWYYLGADGAMEAGKWITTGDKSYFLAADGVMQSGVIRVDGKTYYLGAATDGAMKTGEQAVAGTKYNFGTDGACTDEKAPAAEKHFDKYGNEITPEIEVEQVAGMTCEITNALPNYKEAYGNVLFAGKDAYLKVLVTDDNGKPVANTAVSVLSKITASTGGGDEVFGLKGGSVQTTDANGYATFVVGVTDATAKVTPTSGHSALFKLTVTAVSTNQSKEIDLSFATITMNSKHEVLVPPTVVDVLNENDKNDSLLEKPSTNSAEKGTSVRNTRSIGGKRIIEYVFSQQVNEKGSTSNKVEIEVDPRIVIPVVGEKKVVNEYQQDVNKEIKDYSVYQDGSATSFKIEGIPAGLEYANLNFASVDISEYTEVRIETYRSDNNKHIDTYYLRGPITQKDFSYQLPVQEDTGIYVVVKVLSEGQVDDDQNAGLVIKDVTGLYKKDESANTVEIPMKDSVTWTKVTNKYSETKTLNEAVAKQYITETDEKYTAKGNTYKYQVPVYPYTGNAVMTVTDSNKNVVGYFAIPTENVFKLEGVTKPGYQNENDIVSYEDVKAVLISKDEAFNNVGSIETDGNKVIVNSEETGITSLQAKITLPGFEDEIDLTEDTVYTSVQWAPVPNSVEENAQFYALVGQNVTVKAQLVDKNGNAVAGNKNTITFKCKGAEVPVTGPIKGTAVEVIKKDETTDANGQAILKINSGSELALLESLEAECSEYAVVLTIGDKTVEKADLRWVEAGLAFTSAVPQYKYNETTKKNDQLNKDYVKVDTLDKTLDKLTDADKETFARVLSKDTGSNWIFGYEVIGKTQDKVKSTEGTDTTQEVISIDGLKVNLTKSADGTIVTDGMANGTAKLTSNKNGATRLTGTVNKDSLVAGTDVIFNIDTNGDGTPEQYKNVGEGAPSIETSLDLPITWGIVGEQLSLVSPKGNSFVVNAGDQVYIKVADEFGGIIGGKDVEYTVTYAGKDGKTYDYNGTLLSGNTNATTQKNSSSIANGLIEIPLKHQISQKGDIKSATITAKYGNVTLTENNVITYKNADVTPTDFALANAKYDVKSGKGIVELTFTSPVNSTSVMKDMFEITSTVAGKVVIGDVTVDSQDSTKVILTLDDVNPTLSREGVYTVTVDNTKEVAGITYELCDNNGKGLVEKTVDFTTNSKATGLTYTLVGTTLEVVCDNNTATNATYRVVYNGNCDVTTVNSKKIVTEESGVADVASSNNKITLTLNNAVTIDGDITVYHNGGSVTISKADLIKHFATNKIDDVQTMNNGLALINSQGVKLKDKDENPLTTGIVILTNYADNGKGVWVETDYIVTAVSVAAGTDGGKFLTVANSAQYNGLTFKNVLTFDPDSVKSATPLVDDVTVTYADKNDTTVTKTVTYTATTNGSTIVFTKKQPSV